MRRTVRIVTSVLLASAVALGGVAATTSPASASDGVAFDWFGSAEIPDSPSACTPGTPLELPIAVSGIPVGAALSDVRVANLRLTHTYAGDLTVTLIAPDSSQVVLFGRTGSLTAGAVDDSSDLEGPYRFTDRAPGTDWWTAAAAAGISQDIPSGYYRASTPGGTADGGKGVSITGAFAGLADANGTWILQFVDRCNSDIGTVTAASLQFEIASARCNSVAAAVVEAQEAYDAAVGVSGAASQAVSDATGPLVTAQNARGAAQTAAATAKAAATNARTAAQQAGTARDAASDAVIAADAALARATATLTKAQATVVKATTALAAAKRSHKKAAIAKATKTLKTAQQAQKTAAAKVTTAAGVLNAAKTALTTARQAATVKVQARQAADDALDTARDTLDQAQATLATAAATYAEAIRLETIAIAQADLAMAAVDHAQDDLFDCTQE